MYKIVGMLAWILLGVFGMIFTLLFFLLAIKIQHLLDRYRLKYGFDRELERKEIDKPNEEKLDKKEQYFKKRVYKD